jgi:hypothetical protein
MARIKKKKKEPYEYSLRRRDTPNYLKWEVEDVPPEAMDRYV